jgi:hypothetical protein
MGLLSSWKENAARPDEGRRSPSTSAPIVAAALDPADTELEGTASTSGTCDVRLLAFQKVFVLHRYTLGQELAV